MPHARRTLSERALGGLCRESFEATGRDQYGVEAEWPTHRHDDVATRPAPAEMAALTDVATPRGSRVTFEPGGQLELSTVPAGSIGEALSALAEDREHVHAAAALAGYSCVDLAVDGRRPPRRVVTSARYEAMEAFFATRGTSGAWMMNSTASTQVNVSHDEDEPYRRWSTLNRIAPLLIATFANSPGLDLHGERWVCLREAIWWATDPGRTRPVRLDLPPCTAWLEYALAADVAFICTEGSGGAEGHAVLPGLSFGHWMETGHPSGWPTVDDFRYHLTMLFPPVRPRGWLELRVLDALPDWLRTVAGLVVATATTADAGRELEGVLPETGHLWLTASRVGVRDPRLARAGEQLLEVVARHLGLVTDDPEHVAMVAEFADRYTGRRRMPGDDAPAGVDLRLPGRSRTFA